MYKIKIIVVGKTDESWLETAIADYVKRLQALATLTFCFVKTESDLLRLVQKEKQLFCLDALGSQMSSEKFSTFLLTNLVKYGARLTFVIGGAEGLPDILKKSHPLISFSPMTFTHQIIRLILVEQIYRAIQISIGSPYHK